LTDNPQCFPPGLDGVSVSFGEDNFLPILAYSFNRNRMPFLAWKKRGYVASHFCLVNLYLFNDVLWERIVINEHVNPCPHLEGGRLTVVFKSYSEIDTFAIDVRMLFNPSGNISAQLALLRVASDPSLPTAEYSRENAAYRGDKREYFGPVGLCFLGFAAFCCWELARRSWPLGNFALGSLCLVRYFGRRYWRHLELCCFR
jgi:hypothetical protein